MASYDDEKIRDSGLTEREESTLAEWAQERIKELRKEQTPKFVKGGILDNVGFEIDGKVISASVKSVDVGADGSQYLHISCEETLSVLPRSTNTLAVVPRGMM